MLPLPLRASPPNNNEAEGPGGDVSLDGLVVGVRGARGVLSTKLLSRSWAVLVRLKPRKDVDGSRP